MCVGPNMVKLVLESQFRAPRDSKLTQMLNKHETLGGIIDFFAHLGYYMNSMRQKGAEDTTKDEAQVALGVKRMAFTWDNCNHETYRGVHGDGQHISAVACLGIMGRSWHVRLSTFHGHRRQKDMTRKEITEGAS